MMVTNEDPPEEAAKEAVEEAASDECVVRQAAIRRNIAKEHQREILEQIDEARNKMRREMELAALELEASRREEAAYQVRFSFLFFVTSTVLSVLDIPRLARSHRVSTVFVWQ